MEYRIGLYDENKTLIGYKADTFWSVTKKPEHAKRHRLVNGSIDPELIKNLHKILRRDTGKGSGVNALIAGIAEINRHRFFGNFETMLVGYDSEEVAPSFTHRVFMEGVEPLEPRTK